MHVSLLSFAGIYFDEKNKLDIFFRGCEQRKYNFQEPLNLKIKEIKLTFS